MATTQTDSFGMSPEFIAAQQAKANAAKTVSAAAPIETANIGGTAPSPSTNAPIAPVAPVQPVTPPTPTPTAQTPSVKPIGQAVSDSFGMSDTFVKQQQAKAQQADQTVEKPSAIQPQAQPETKPLSTAPVSMPKQPVAKAEPQVNFNTSVGREQDVIHNLDNFYKSGALDLQSLRKMSGYDTADQAKKDLIDAYYQSKQPKDVGGLFNDLVMNGRIMNRDFANTPEGIEAQHRFDVVSPYKGASTDSLYAAMTSNKLTPGSEPYNDLVKANGGIETPEMIAAKKRFNEKVNSDIINRDSNILAANGTKVTPETSATKTVTDSVVSNKGMDYALEFQKDIVDNPEIANLSTKVTQTDKEIADLEAEKSKVMKRILADHPGIPSGLLYDVAQEQIAPMNEQITMLTNKRNQQSADLDYKTQIAQKKFDYKMEQNKQAQAFEQQKLLAVFQSDLALSQNQKEFEQKIAQQAQAMKDPTLATQSVLDTYEKMGILPSRSSNEIIADVQKQVANGVPLAKALSDLNKSFQSKKEYKQYMTNKFQETLSDREKIMLQSNLEDKRTYNAQQWDLKKIAITNNLDLQKIGMQYDLQDKKESKAAYYDLVGKGMTPDQANAAIASQTGDWSKVKGTALLSAPNESIIPSRLSQTTNKNGGKECAEFTNDVTGGRMPSGFRGKLDQCNINLNGASTEDAIKAGQKVPAGSVAVWQPTNDPRFTKYGHTGIVMGTDPENPNNLIIRSSNLKGKGEISTASVPMSEIFGYDTKNKANLSLEKQYSADDISLANSIVNNPNISITPTKQAEIAPLVQKIISEKVEKETDPAMKEIIQSGQYSKQTDATVVKQLTDLKTAVSMLDNVDSMVSKEDTGPIIGRLQGMNPYDVDAQALTSALNGMVPKVARGVFGEVGVLTDADVQQYLKTIPSLNKTEDVNKAVSDLLRMAAYKSAANTIVTNAQAGRNMTGFQKDYKNIKKFLDSKNISTDAFGGETSESTGTYTGPNPAGLNL